MATDETASPQRPIEPELEAVKQALAAREAEVRSLRQLLDARTAELAVRNTAYSEQIEHQSATIDVLKAMSASPGDPQPVFDLIVRRARELCDAPSAGLLEFDGKLVHFRSLDNHESVAFEDAFAAYKRLYPMAPTRSSIVCRAILDRRILHITDMDSETDIIQAARNLGHKSVLAVPLMWNDAAIGVIALNLWNKGGFSDSQVQLLKTFAEQAVIAIRSAETYRELQQRTAELAARNTEFGEKIDHQSATIDVLKAMSASPDDPQPVFEQIVRHARELCESNAAAIFEFDGRLLHFKWASHDPAAPAEYFASTTAFLARFPMAPDHDTAIGRAVIQREIINLRVTDNTTLHTSVRSLGITYVLALPLLHDGEPVGVIVLNTRKPVGFSESQVALLQTFAEQVAIATLSAETYRALQQRTRDLTESLEQQTSTAEVLQVINANPGTLTPVFEAILEKAHSLCGAPCGSLQVFENGQLRAVATRGMGEQFSEMLRRGVAVSTTRLHRLQDQNEAAQIADLAEAVRTMPDEPTLRAAVELAGIRTFLSVPLRKDDAFLGRIVAARQEVRPFTENQIALLRNFAAQAVIAMENARLLTETRESLEQQTATAEVLKVISRSAFDLETVLDTLIASAVRLCNASRGEVFVRDGDLFRIRAHAGIHLPDLLEFLQQNPIKIGRETVTGRVAMTGEVHNIADIVEDAEYEFPGVMEHRALRSRLGVPLVRDGRVEGVLHLSREESQPFTPRQVELVSTFADQAVIALENARLFDAVQQRTRDLTETLEQQTATAEVLKVISRSAFDLQAVLETLIESAARLCNAPEGIIYLRDDETLRVRAVTGVSNTLLQFIRENPHRVGSKSLAGRVLTTGAVVNVADIALDPDYDYPGIFEHGGGTRPSGVGAPLLRDGRIEGVMTLGRPQALPFSPRQVELLTTFADQAVIAIENARLFDEVQARTRELTQSVSELQALEEVLRAVNSSLDLQTVLSTIISRAVPLAEADEGMIYEFDAADEVFVPKAAYGMSDDRIAWLRERRIRVGETFLGRSAAERVPIHIVDVQQDPSTPEAPEILPGIHAVLAVPLLREDKVIGGLVIRRRSEGAFAANTVTLMQTFAGQSVLAIENARLFQEAERARAAAETALNDLRRAQDRLIQSEKMASLGQLTAGIAHEIKNPLNFVNNFSALSTELIDELRTVLANATVDGPTRAEVEELGATIKGNLEKVVQHGKRADAIVKNMLLHARESGGERRSVDLNATVDEALNLAYHGARAEKPGFTITLERNFDPAAGSVELYPQEFTRVMLNLFSNGFYAATRKAGGSVGAEFQPTLAVATDARPTEVVIRVRDNGTGIPDSARARLFEPFFTTKPAGEGTGLGLSLSHDIIVKQHGGSIAVDSRIGEYTEFTITLPRANAEGSS